MELGSVRASDFDLLVLDDRNPDLVLGDDPFGSFMRAALAERGVNTRGIVSIRRRGPGLP